MRYILRKDPEFKITLDPDSFTVLDLYRKGQSGKYSYAEVKKVHLREKQVNLFIILVSLLIDGGGNVRKEPWRLDILLKSKRIRFYPQDKFLSDTKSAARALQKRV